MLEEYDKSFIQAYKAGDSKELDKLTKEFQVKAFSDEKLALQVKADIKRVIYNMEQLKLSSEATVAIFGFIGKNVPPWDPDTAKSGIAGSEEAIIYSAFELAKLGYKVTIFANTPEDSLWQLPISNPRFVNADEFSASTDKFSVGLAWRRTDFRFLKSRCEHIFFWPHDVAHGQISDRDLEMLDGAFFLSDYHMKDYVEKTPKLKDKKYVISGNGIQLEHFKVEGIKRDPMKCVYISNYGRGLQSLIKIWPEIRSKYPQATLDIYYGRETYGVIDSTRLDKLLVDIAKLEKQGVRECGKVGHEDLAKALLGASIWAYPCNTNTETYCISAVKAQAAGCIPVVTTPGALKETVLSSAPQMEQYDENKYTALLLETLARCASTDEKVMDQVAQERKKYIEFASTKTWAASVKEWTKIMPNTKVQSQEILTQSVSAPSHLPIVASQSSQPSQVAEAKKSKKGKNKKKRR